MDLQEFSILIKAMKAVYTSPSFIPDDDAKNVWYGLLCDLPYKAASASLQAFMMSSSKYPTPADIRAGIRKFRDDNLNEMEAWDLVSRAVRRSAYYAQEEYDKLPPDIQKAVGSPNQLEAWSKSDLEALESVIQSNFIRTYRTVLKRREEREVLSPNLLQVIGNIGLLEAQ